MNRTFSNIKVNRLLEITTSNSVGSQNFLIVQKKRDKVLFRDKHKKQRLLMPANTLPPLSIFHMLEKSVGKRILVILNQSYGFEGILAALTHEPPGVWLSSAEAVIFRATIANPIPQITGREDRSEIFINLNAVQRIEVLHEDKE